MTLTGFLFLLAVDLLVLSLLAFPLLRDQAKRHFSVILSSTPTLTPSPYALLSPSEPQASSTSLSSITPTLTLTPKPESAPPSIAFSKLAEGMLILSLGEGGYYHLFAYQPMGLPFTRLTQGEWDDITPSVSPDHTKVAFASNRSGYWDLYLLDLTNGEIERLTNTPEYEASPSWSPDGRFLAYEIYTKENLEIAIRSITGDEAFILLSEHPAADFSPSWSPQGRILAFISTRSGEAEVWLADLDKAGEERFTNLSQSPLSIESSPVWSPDGHALVWSTVENGIHNLYTYRNGDITYIGSGDLPIWSPDGSLVASVLSEPNQSILTAYDATSCAMVLPPVVLPGPVHGMTWANVTLPVPLPQTFALAAELTPTPLWSPALVPATDIPGGRQHLVTLQDVEAPYPMLHDLVDESFFALRARVAAALGWDFLAALENAYFPITASLPPGLANDWLQTGRAIAINTLPMNAGWMAVVPEAYGLQTYWRVYLRTREQDGSQGAPLHAIPWNFNARYSGNPLDYEMGGAPMSDIPSGYWVDFTDLAAAYGWERLPALLTWRTYYPAARFNEFVLSGGQDWRSAMLELYPPEALITPTAIIPPTLTPTPVPIWQRTATPTPTLLQPMLAVSQPTETPIYTEKPSEAATATSRSPDLP